MHTPSKAHQHESGTAADKPTAEKTGRSSCSGTAARARVTLGTAILIVSAIFLFFRLGHNALWDDEANTALIAKGVWKTGDTTAVMDHNVVAYRNGWTLRNLHERATPPLSFYLAAPFIGGLGETALAARLPFAFCGLGCVILMVWWLARERAGGLTWILFTMGLLGNVSFFLFCRQARYYGLAMVLSAVAAYLYLHSDRRWKFLALGLALVGLFATQYLLFAAVYAALVVDYLVWGRKTNLLTWRELGWFLIPQLVIGAVIFAIWNPFTTAVAGAALGNTVPQKLALFWFNLRDLSRGEFGAGLLLLACPIVARVTHERWLLRGWIALIVYVGALSAISVQPFAQNVQADIRYLTPVILLCIALGALCLRAATKGNPWLACPLAALAFGTSLFHGSWLPNFGPSQSRVHSTIHQFVGELCAPQNDPYTLTADWINRNVEPGRSVLAMPEWTMYPLMYHAPQAVYAWQLNYPPTDLQFLGLPPIHFMGQAPPDFVIFFSAGDAKLLENLRSAGGDYAPVERINCFWFQPQRPELFFHAFTPVTRYDADREGIYVFRRSINEPPPK